MDTERQEKQKARRTGRNQGYEYSSLMPADDLSYVRTAYTVL